MLDKLKSADRDRLALLGIALALVLFVSLNTLSNQLFRNARLDLTAERLFTISDGTKEVLAAIDEPIVLRYYRSGLLDRLGPVYSGHAERVGDLLSEYARIAGDKLRIERYDPQPFSPEEDLAVADGLQGAVIDNSGTQLFFGLVGRNSTDDSETIAFLAPERANFLEYDLTRLIQELARPEKAVVAVIGDLPLRGDQQNRFQPWYVLESMQQFFEVRSLGGSIDAIDEEVELLMLVQPGALDEKTLYAIDQFVMGGGRVLAFIDPFVEESDRSRMGAPPPESAVAKMEPLLKAWGIEIPEDQVVGDLRTATQVRAPYQGRQVVTNYLPWLGLSNTYFNGDDVVTGKLKQLNLRSTGWVAAREGATTTLEPLVRSSELAMAIDVEPLRMAPDPVGLLNNFQGRGEAFTLAARVSGPVKSAFPDGPPAAVTDEAIRDRHRAEAEQPLNAIVVADADFLADANWLQSSNLLGQRLAIPVANNGDFTVNALDNLKGSQGLIGLRGRGLANRPFEVLRAMQIGAEEQYRAKEQALLTRITEAEEKIRSLQEQEQQSGVLLSGEQQATIEQFRADVLGLRRELRDVQHALNQDVERLQSWLRAFNIWAVPLLIGIVTAVLALVRRRRAVRFQATLQH